MPDEEAQLGGGGGDVRRDLTGRDALLPQLLDQAERVARRLGRRGCAGRTVTLKVKYADFEPLTRR